MDRQFIIDSLRFWDTFPDERKTGEAEAQLEARVRVAVVAMADDTRSDFREIARRQYAEQEAIKVSVTGRASTLLLFVGVISTGATVVAASLASTQLIVLGLTVLVGGCLMYGCLAVAFLSVRAQEVARWVVPDLDPSEAADARALAVEDTVRHTVAYQQNEPGVRHLVAYLADAQRWARRAVILVVLLAILSVLASATKSEVTSSDGSVPTARPSGAAPSASGP